MNGHTEAAVGQLRDLNISIGEHELLGAGGVEFFRAVLDDAFVFRRASGTTIDREAFLASLSDPASTTEELTTTVQQVQVLGDQAFVEAYVRLRGVRGGKAVMGTFRNLRLFELREGTWRLVMWFNRPFEAA